MRGESDEEAEDGGSSGINGEAPSAAPAVSTASAAAVPPLKDIIIFR